MYTPSDDILANYADVLINYALGSGNGIQPGETVLLKVCQPAAPILPHLMRTVYAAGGHVMVDFIPDGIARIIYEHGSEEQLTHMPTDYLLAKADTVDHMAVVIAESDKFELDGIDPAKIMARRQASKFFRDRLDQKETNGKFTRTIALYGTPAMADVAGLSLKAYRKQIVSACFLDTKDPIAKRREVAQQSEAIKSWLNSLEIDYLDMQGEGVDLRVQIGPNRTWMGG